MLCFGAGRWYDGRLFLALELCSRGSLRQILENDTISWPQFRQLEIALHAARGIDYLHGMQPVCIHRDIKSPNVLVSEGWVAKIADFGSSKLIDKAAPERHRPHTSLERSRQVTTDAGTLLWSAPEVMAHQPHSTQSDVYRCACDD